jgi:hypothetical protein
VSDTSLGSLFWDAAQQSPAAAAEAPGKASSCFGPKPAAEKADAAEKSEAPKKASSCCGPKPAAEAEDKPKQTSCCGPKPAAAAPADQASAPAKKSCCG